MVKTFNPREEFDWNYDESLKLPAEVKTDPLISQGIWMRTSTLTIENIKDFSIVEWTEWTKIS